VPANVKEALTMAMTLREKLKIIDNWLIFRRRTYAVPGHFDIFDNGKYEVMTPIDDAKGYREVFNIRLENLSDDELQQTVKEIRGITGHDSEDFVHIEWPFACSERIHLAIRGEIPMHPMMDELVFGIMMPEDAPACPEITRLTLKRVATREDFAIWCRVLYNDEMIWVYDEEKHFHLVESGEMICLLAFVGEKLVATPCILNEKGAAAFEHGEVLAKYQNSEVLIAIYQHAIRQAFEAGVNFVIGYTHPKFAPDSYAVFKKLGFLAVTS